MHLGYDVEVGVRGSGSHLKGDWFNLDILNVLMLEQCPCHEDMFILYFTGMVNECEVDGHMFFYSKNSILSVLDQLHQERDLNNNHHQFYRELVEASTIQEELKDWDLAKAQHKHRKDPFLPVHVSRTIEALVGRRH